MRRALLAILALTMPMSTFAGFNALYDGVPDLELNSFVQKSARTFTMVVCNRGDTANGLGSIVLTVKGKAGKSIERTIAGVSIQSGRCQSFEVSSAGTFGKPSDRNYDMTASIVWDGARREIELSNNKYVLKPSVPMTDGGNVSTNPGRDLWGTSNGSTWYVPSNSSNYYPSSGTNNPLNFSPAGNFYGQTPQYPGNVVYVYQNNPYAGSNSYSTFDSSHPCWKYYNSGSNYRSSTNTYNTFDYVSGSNNSNNGYYVNCDTYNSCYRCSTNGNCNNSNCYNNGNCYNNNSNCYDSLPDLYVSNIRQNGTSREFVVNVCNYGANITSGITSNIRLTIGNYTKDLNFFTSLASNACQDVYFGFNLMDIYYSGNYTVRAEVDTVNGVRERNEGNNYLSRVVTVNYN